MLEKLISIFAPHQCIGCDAEGSLLCPECSGTLPTAPGRCYHCKALSSGGRTCLTCRRDSKLYTVQAVSRYDGLAKELIGQLKFSGARNAIVPMAELMINHLLVGEDIVIVHLPTASSRIRQRGYDQAALLANEVSRQSGRPYVACLTRTGQQRQVGASRRQRLTQLQDSLRVRRPQSVKGRHIVVIDDVMTTGASLEAAASVLKAAGAKRISAVVFACA